MDQATPVPLIAETFLEPFPRYPQRRLFSIRCIGNSQLLAECSEIEHRGHRWRMVRISAEDGAIRRSHVEFAHQTFFAPDARVITEANPATGRVRLLQQFERTANDSGNVTVAGDRVTVQSAFGMAANATDSTGRAVQGLSNAAAD